MSKRLLSSLRPYVCRECRAHLAVTQAQHRRASSTTQPSTPPSALKKSQALDNVETVERRIAKLGGKDALDALFPRWPGSLGSEALSAAEFSNQYKKFSAAPKNTGEVTVYGRVTGRRLLGNNLLFLELSTSEKHYSIGIPAQVIVNQSTLESEQHILQPKAVKDLDKRLKRGDWVAVTGKLGEDKQGQCRINATQLPLVLALALQEVPLSLADEEYRMRNRHADQIVNPSTRDILYLRSHLINGIRQFLQNKDFIEVNTPLLVAGAGGAIARPFQTVATEFLDLNLNLRVAPELFLKRLIVGGMQKVFEIGPAFRNEGVDATHNPEFSICEFYSIMANLEDLMKMTEDLFTDLVRIAESARRNLSSLPELRGDFIPPFKRLEFIPCIEKEVRTLIPDWTFPDLTKPDALSILTETAIDVKVQFPIYPTLPRLLDAFAARFLEPLCQNPTFITHHPECMSPLAKSFLRDPIDPLSSTLMEPIRHRVSARAELFIQSREYVNCYEEENSPIEQRRKFEEQLTYRNKAEGEDAPETHAVVDESYVKALEWGMPPTGGWGCGIDRIVMLFSGKSRIADVLPFGNLRNVVGLGSASLRAIKEKEAAVAVSPKAEEHESQVGVPRKSAPKQWPSAEPKTETANMKSKKQASVKSAGNDTDASLKKNKKATSFSGPTMMSFKDLLGTGDGREGTETMPIPPVAEKTEVEKA